MCVNAFLDAHSFGITKITSTDVKCLVLRRDRNCHSKCRYFSPLRLALDLAILVASYPGYRFASSTGLRAYESCCPCRFGTTPVLALSLFPLNLYMSPLLQIVFLLQLRLLTE